MQPFQISYEEIVANLHPLSPQPSKSRMLYVGYTIDPQWQRIISVELSLDLIGGDCLRLRFVDVWRNSLPGELSVPNPLGLGVLVVDVRRWGWEMPIIVVADDEDFRTIFGAGSVEVISS